MSKISLLFTLIALMVINVSCRHKGFCEEHPHGSLFIEVEYDDDNDLDDADYIRTNIRATRLLVYHQSTNAMILKSDIGRITHELHLDNDSYHFLAYNAGTQTLTFSNHNLFYDHSVATRECDILEPLYESRAVKSDIDLGNGEDVVIGAEPIWSIGAESLICELGDTIRMNAIPLHCRYTYEMRNVEGLNKVSRMSSFITGMARGATLSVAELHNTPVTVAVTASIGPDKKSIVGSFFCFGQNPHITTRHRMGLFVEMETGEKYKLLEGKHFDVTDQVVGAKNRRRVHIIIDGVKLPDPGTGAGFDVTVTPWGAGEDIDINY